MLRKSKKQPQTVSEKVSKLLAHPNDSDSDDSSDNDVSTAAHVVDFEDEYDLPDARTTDIRKRNVKLLSEQSERYKGKISSRKELEQDEDEDDDDDDDDDEEELAFEESDTDEDDAATLEAFNKKLKASKSAGNDEQQDDDDDEFDNEEDDAEDDSENDPEGDAEDDSEGDSEDDSEGDSDDAASDDNAMEATKIISKTNQQAEIQKGLCVQNQLRIWERLLELRINAQKVSSKVNQLPAPAALKSLSNQNDELQVVLNEAQERSSKLLQQLLALQSALTQQHTELRQSVKRKQPPEEEQESTEPASKRYANVLQSNFQNMRSYRNDVLLKWDDRTKLLTPGAGAKRKSVQEDYDIIKKIDNALSNREALVEKSQTLRNQQQQQREEHDDALHSQRQPHIYDDSDFYHQQLRELIEYKASTTSNMSDITKQFVELQKLRQKMKRKVDTRASKGRKLRYVVHNKLINYMAPNEDSDWTEDSKTELYKSLFV